jgi:hypothetical protein
VPENSEHGYIKPSSEVLLALRPLEEVSKLAYRAGVGPRCAECRNSAARAALAAVPADWPDDPLEKRLFQYHRYGLFEQLPAGGWGPSYSRAARQRALPFDTFSLTERRWLVAPQPVTEGVAVWRFVRAVATGAQRIARVVLELDCEGRSPVYWSRALKAGLGRRVGFETGVEWRVGPAPEGAAALDRSDHEGLLISLAGPSQRRLRAPAQGETGWIGLEPGQIYDWLTARPGG